MLSKSKNIILLIVFALSVILFIQKLGAHGIEYRDDEVFYYKTTQIMLASGDYLTPQYLDEIRFQKPILFYWFVLLSFKIFGETWFAARLVSVIFAALTIMVSWMIADKLFNRRVAHLSAIILATFPLVFRHARNVVPDMALTFFTVFSCFCVIQFLSDPSKKRYPILFFISCGLGFMVKGFVPLIIPLLFLLVNCFIEKKWELLKKFNFPLGIAILAVIIVPWFYYMIQTHGDLYLNHILVKETQGRMIAPEGPQNILLKIGVTFYKNTLFYLNTMLNYFSPWSIFGLGAIPLSLYHLRTKNEAAYSLRLMLAWFIIVFLFFASVSYVMSHYILVLATPLSILLSYFFLHVFSKESTLGQATNLTRTVVIELFLILSFLAYAFLVVFLVHASTLWLIPIFIGLILVLVQVIKSKDALMAPLILGLFMIFIQLQQGLLLNAGVSAHSTLQKIAQTIKQDTEKYSVGVGSHDIHEKEFQIYFDRYVRKSASANPELTRLQLAELFERDEKIYCLITEKDYNTYLADSNHGPFKVVREDYMFRKRLYLDRDFFMSIIQFNKEDINDYLMEKVILLKREANT